MINVIYFLEILAVLIVGVALGWFYCYYYRVRPLKKKNTSLITVKIREIETRMGTITARTSEFPLDPAEYIQMIKEHEQQPFYTEEELEHHIRIYSKHMMSRQKRDFLKMCKEIKNGRDIARQIGGES